MRLIKTTDAVGHILCHDLTQIIKDEFKGVRFHKGHVIAEEDVPVLLSMGKEHLYVWEKQEGMLHEDEAAEILYVICAGESPHIERSAPREGKIEATAGIDGLLVIDTDKLRAINSMGQMMIATRHSCFPVRAGDKLAGTRIIPLLIESDKMEKAKALAGNKPILSIHPFLAKKAAIITTGSEVFAGRVKDTFTPVLVNKLSEYAVEVISHVVLGDDPEQVTQAIHEAVRKGADIILCSGGMSVDPDDRTPLAIKNTNARIVTYGAPVLPGAMFMLAYMDGAAASSPVIMGLPGCVMYAKRTIFDLILPRVIADVEVKAEDLALLGHGGLCLSCDPCTFPNCGFGKGI